MSDPSIGIVGAALLLFLILLGTPIAFSLTAVALGGIVLLSGWTQAFTQAALVFYEESTNFILVAIPMFVLMGNLVRHTGIASDLFTCGARWFGRLPGGVAIAAVMGCAGFGAVTGSSTATVSAMGRIVVPELSRLGYDRGLAAGSLAASGGLGILIPPSIIFIFYGAMTGTSIGDLFIAGIGPAFLTVVVFSLLILGICWLNPALGPATEAVSWSTKIRSLALVFPVVLLFVAMIGGLYIGIFTPTEASGVGVVFVLIFSLAMRKLTFSSLLDATRDTMRLTVMIFAIVVGGHLASRFFTLTGATEIIVSEIVNLGLPAYGYLLLFTALILVLGCVLDVFGMIILTVPFLFPVVVEVGIDPVWFGVYIVILAEIALITPPVGVNVLILRAIIPSMSSAQAFRCVAPFFVGQLVVLFLIAVFPSIVLFLI